MRILRKKSTTAEPKAVRNECGLINTTIHFTDSELEAIEAHRGDRNQCDYVRDCVDFAIHMFSLMDELMPGFRSQ